jgi:hypothetical protein
MTRYVEHEHQKALIRWALRARLPAAPDITPGATVSAYLLAIPNGGQRSPREAARLRAEGVKAGVSDLLFPIPRQGKAGLWIELKAPKGRPTPAQREWLEKMSAAGYVAEWRDDWTAAANLIANYVGMPTPYPELPK